MTTVRRLNGVPLSEAEVNMFAHYLVPNPDRTSWRQAAVVRENHSCPLWRPIDVNTTNNV